MIGAMIFWVIMMILGAILSYFGVDLAKEEGDQEERFATYIIFFFGLPFLIGLIGGFIALLLLLPFGTAPLFYGLGMAAYGCAWACYGLRKLSARFLKAGLARANTSLKEFSARRAVKREVYRFKKLRNQNSIIASCEAALQRAGREYEGDSTALYQRGKGLIRLLRHALTVREKLEEFTDEYSEARIAQMKKEAECLFETDSSELLGAHAERLIENLQEVPNLLAFLNGRIELLIFQLQTLNVPINVSKAKKQLGELLSEEGIGHEAMELLRVPVDHQNDPFLQKLLNGDVEDEWIRSLREVGLEPPREEIADPPQPRTGKLQESS